MANNPEQAFLGFQPPETFGSDFNAKVFLIKSILAGIRTSTIVQVQSCTNNGGVSPVGTVNVVPMVNQLDGFGNQMPHGQIYSLPYVRVQGGANAVIIDPQPGDIGIAIFSDRDISNVISTKQTANPGSNRKFDMADGIYIGGILNAAPTQYVQFSSNGINITATGKVVLTDGTGSTIVMNNDHTGSGTFSGGFTLNAAGGVTVNAASGMTVNANMQVNGTVTATGEGTFNGGHTVSQHSHHQGPDSLGAAEQDVSTPFG